MIINHNISALRGNNELKMVNKEIDKSIYRLSSGYRINKAGDDAAGMAISRRMRTQIEGLDQSSRNAADGISVIQTAEGALNEVTSMLQRMRELSVQAANGTQAQEDREAIQSEIEELTSEIKRISSDTEFNTKGLLDGTYDTNPMVVQIGANEGQTMSIRIPEISPDSLFISEVDLCSQEGAEQAINRFDLAIDKITEVRSSLGAYQNRLEHAVNTLDESSLNLTGALSRIEDVDMAKEMTEYTQKNVLSQTGTAMLAQANERPQTVLSLLQG